MEITENEIKFTRRIASFLASMLGNVLSPDEVLSAAFAGLCEAAASFDASRGVELKTHAYLRIRGAVFDAYRSGIRYSKRFTAIEPEEEERLRSKLPSPEDALINASRNRLVSVLLSQLPGDEASIIKSYYFEDRPTAEIAHLHGRKTRGWTSKAHSKGIRSLKRIVANLREDELKLLDAA